MIAATLLALALPLAGDSVYLDRGLHDPAVAADGRIAVAAQGDLWILPAAGAAGGPLRLTRDEAWDDDPAWTADGAVVFSSDRGGSRGIWRVAIGGGAPERLTAGGDSEPAPLGDGALVFVRGSGATADLWLRAADGGERRLTEALGAERSPSASPDGRRVVYVEEHEGRRRMRVRAIEGKEDRVIAGDYPAEEPAWSPDGERIAFTTRGGRPGVWIAASDGRYVNQVSERSATPAWGADGSELVLAVLPREDAGYNGDPDRRRGDPGGDGDRSVGTAFPQWGRLWRLRPGAVPDADIVAVDARLPLDRAEHHARLFDRVWGWLSAQYRDEAGRRDLEEARADARAGALAAPTPEALEHELHRAALARPTFRNEVTGEAAVSSAHPLATAAGLEMLRRGGNVVDAAVAVSFALGVVEPDASGIGGYGTMLVHLAGWERPRAIEFLTRVPQAATLGNAALEVDGELPSDGPVVVNVPGTVAGMWHAWENYGSGKLAWADLVQPAVELAEGGFVLDESFPTTLRVERERYAKYPSSKALFFPGGEPLSAGDTLRNPDLAWTLREIARGGAEAFYEGEIARRMVADLHGRGNAMRLHDMARYHAVERDPVVGTYHGATVYSSPPATSGGAILIAKLNLLELAGRGGPFTEDAATLHAMIEAWKLMPGTSGRIADPGLWPVNLDPFTSKDTARARWLCFDAARSSAPADAGAPACDPATRTSAQWGADHVLGCPPPDHASRGGGCRMTGTTAFAVGDAAGNLVSVTQTLGTWGGNFYVTPGLGFLYNDKLRSYGDDVDAYNARIPFARNVTSISPTLLFHGTGDRQRPWMALGAAGNAWINSAVYQMIVGVVDEGLGPQRAIELPRFLVGGERLPGGARRTVVQMENGFAPEVVERLREMGHELQIISRVGELRMGYGAAVEVEGGEVRAGADPRRSGAAAALPRR